MITNPYWIIGITLAILQASVIFTSIYLHRYRTHEAVVLSPAVAHLMHLELALFTGIIPREWVAVHRKHHGFADREGDPHSPYLLGVWPVFLGNYGLYRKERSNKETLRVFTPKWENDLLDRIPKVKLIGRSLGFLVLVALFGWKWAVAAWLFHVIAYILLNSSINSFCHTADKAQKDGSYAIDRPILAVFTGGEGNHGGHHEQPTSPNFARKPGQFDPSWPILRGLEFLGLAKVG